MNSMPNGISKFFTAPLFDHQKRTDQARLLNQFLMIGLGITIILMVVLFISGVPRTGFFLAAMAVYILANKALLHMMRYMGASWAFMIGITLINFVFGGMFPEFPLLAITLPFLIVSACLLLNFNSAVLMLVINLVGFAAFVQPVWGGDVQDLASLGATVLSAILVMVMVNQYAILKEKHLGESQKLCKQMEKDYQSTMEELTRTKDVLMREHENRKELDKKSSQPDMPTDSPNRFNPHTGIMTEDTIRSILESEIARTRRYQRPLSLMSIKVDDFEEIILQADLRGDMVLSSLCDLFLEALRREDIIGHNNQDGFYVILPETGRYASYVVGERLRHLVEVMNFTGLGDVNLTISVGITAFQDQSKMTPERFFEQSNEAVEAASSHGGNWTISWHDMSHSNR